MKKTKFDERVEKAVNAFFEDPPDSDRFAMTYTGETALVATDTSFSDKAEKWSRLLREVFLLGPGAFCLFYLTLAIAYFYPSYGFSLKGGSMYMFAVFLTYAGAGNISRVKNLAVPGVVIAVALLVVLFSAVFPGREASDVYFWDSIYLFPIVLVLAKLVQSWVSDKS